MVRNYQLETLREIWQIVGDKEFTARDIPQYRYSIRYLEFQGYLIKSGTTKLFYYDRYKEFYQYRISSRYLEILKK